MTIEKCEDFHSETSKRRSSADKAKEKRISSKQFERREELLSEF